MSTIPRPPLLSDEDINDPKLVIPLGAKMIRDIYEAARAKDAELIQMLVDAMSAILTNSAAKKVGEEDLWASAVLDCRRAKNAAAAAGFKPTEP